MGKLLTEPLFVLLLGLLVLQVWGWLRVERRGRPAPAPKDPPGSGRSGPPAAAPSREARTAPAPGRGLRTALLLLTLALWLASTPVASRGVLGSLERPFYGSERLEPGSVDVVVVLSAAVWPGPAPELDLLGSATYPRVDRGAQAFEQSGARYLVVTGGGERPDGDASDLARLMARHAARLGVPEDRILVEPRARTTRAHPGEVLALPEVEPDHRLAVVTSAWHLRRAVREFERHFPDVTPVPAEFLSVERRRGALLTRLLPRAEALHHTTYALHEHIGRVWYHVLALRG